MTRLLLAVLTLCASCVAFAAEAPANADRYPSAMADMAGIIHMVAGMSDICTKVSPKLGEAVGTAAAKWHTRNQKDIAEVNRRVPLLVDRIYREEQKEDPKVKKETVEGEFAAMIASGRSQLAEQVEQSNGRSCIAYIQYLGTDRSNLANQPNDEMRLIRSRKPDGTGTPDSKD